MSFFRAPVAAALSVVAVAGLALTAQAARSQTVVSTGESFISARLLPGIAEADGARLSGLRLEMKPGWKTYWRSPGDAGIPPRFDWSRSDNLAGIEVFWPRPGVFQSFGLQTVGYEGHVVLPVRLRPVDPDRAIDAVIGLQLGVCKDICVLEEIEVAERIGPDTPPIGRRQIARAMDRVPPEGTTVGLTRAECRLSEPGKKRRIHVSLAFAEPVLNPLVVFENTASVQFSGAETTAGSDPIHASARVFLSKDGWFDRSAVRLMVLAEGFAASITGCRGPAD